MKILLFFSPSMRQPILIIAKEMKTVKLKNGWKIPGIHRLQGMKT